MNTSAMVFLASREVLGKSAAEVIEGKMRDSLGCSYIVIINGVTRLRKLDQMLSSVVYHRSSI